MMKILITSLLFLFINLVSFAEESFVGKDAKLLAPLKSELTCASLATIKKNVTSGSPSQNMSKEDILWTDDKGEFLYFNENDWTITACLNGKFAVAKYDRKRSDGAYVSVNRSTVGDLNGDGRPEFSIFYGHCAEGPCLGDYSIYQLDSDKIRKVGNLIADTIRKVSEDSRYAYQLEKVCFNYDFGAQYSYYALVELSKNGDQLELVPFNLIHSKYPKTFEFEKIKRFKDLNTQKRDAKDIKSQTAAKVQGLINEAYSVESSDKLVATYNEVAAKGEGSLPGVHCDPKEIIELIAGKK